MSKTIEKRPVGLRYNGKGYSIHVASNWLVKEIDESQTFFYGPKVGKLRMGFYVTRIDKKEMTYLDIADKSKKKRQKEPNYTVHHEEDISKDNFHAFARRCSWYEPQTDMVLLVREVFTQNDDTIFVLSSSIPNSSELVVLNEAMTHMMNTFRFK